MAEQPSAGGAGKSVLPARHMVSRLVVSALARLGWELRRRPGPGRTWRYADLEPEFLEIYERCAAATMTSIERMYALYQAVRHVHVASTPGDVVECGVWRGGSSMLAAMTLDSVGDRERRLWLYDTFEGMSEPTGADVALSGERMTEGWEATGYPEDRMEFIEGKVEDTLPRLAPDRIAVLRLDTDWYESTRHELEHLWPRLSPGGVLILDDYGHWQGFRQAVDEFLATVQPILLHRIDYTCRLAVKPG
jgi:O-methyltransferase